MCFKRPLFQERDKGKDRHVKAEREWKRKRKEERREVKVLLASVMKESGMIESMKMPEKV